MSKSNAKRLEVIKQEPEKPKQRFFSLVRHQRKPTDHWDPWQIEVAVFRGDKLVHRYFYDKPDMKQMVVGKLELINSLEESDFAKYEIGV